MRHRGVVWKRLVIVLPVVVLVAVALLLLPGRMGGPSPFDAVELGLVAPQLMHLTGDGPATDRTTDAVVAQVPWESLAILVLIAIGLRLGSPARR